MRQKRRAGAASPGAWETIETADTNAGHLLT